MPACMCTQMYEAVCVCCFRSVKIQSSSSQKKKTKNKKRLDLLHNLQNEPNNSQSDIFCGLCKRVGSGRSLAAQR